MVPYWPLILGGILGVAAVGKCIRNRREDKRRRETPCNFDGWVTENDFELAARQAARGIKRVKNVRVDGPVAVFTVKSQSGISTWNFNVDFNDYGSITGEYWLTSDNDDSSIPSKVASDMRNLVLEAIENGKSRATQKTEEESRR